MAKVGASAVIRQYMFGTNLSASRLFAQKALEAQMAGENLTHEERPHDELKAYVSAAVLHSAGFMEASINEFLMDVMDGKFKEVKPIVGERIKVIWSQVLKGNASILPKYQVALSAFDVSVFNQGTQPYQGAATLVKLRNSLVHHTPDSTAVVLGEVNEEEPQNLVKLLSPYVATNPWHDGATTGPLSRVLWADTAEWAISTAVSYVDEFYNRVQIPRPYEHIIDGWLQTDGNPSSH